MPLTDKIDLEKMIASIPGVVYQFLVTSSNEWHFTYISKSIADLFELSPEEVYDNLNCINNCIVEEDLPEHHRLISESVRDMKPWLHEYRIVTAVSRQIKWIRGNALPQRHDDGSSIWYGLLTDITDYIHLKLWQQYHAESLQQDLNQHKQARQELQQQWDRLQELIETRNRQLIETEVTLRNSQGFLLLQGPLF